MVVTAFYFHFFQGDNYSRIIVADCTFMNYTADKLDLVYIWTN